MMNASRDGMLKDSRLATGHADDAQACQAIPMAAVSQKLYNILLEFPDAAIAGVSWSALAYAYKEAYGEAPEDLRLEHLNCHLEEVSIIVSDFVALTPQAGMMSSWPAFYKLLCNAVSRLGCKETLPGELATSLLLSRLLPSLQAESTCESKDINLLLSWLQLGSQPQHNMNSLRFRDEGGQVRSLKKAGHVIKAVLNWRQRYLQRTHEKSAIAKALEPSLSLAFSKDFNNLTLRLSSQAPVLEPAMPPVLGPETISERDLENPFKWTDKSSPLEASEKPLRRHRVILTAAPFQKDPSCLKEPCREGHNFPAPGPSFLLLQSWLGLACLLAQHRLCSH